MPVKSSWATQAYSGRIVPCGGPEEKNANATARALISHSFFNAAMPAIPLIERGIGFDQDLAQLLLA
jgi:hypothetical protein